jgi:hypothetical protein
LSRNSFSDGSEAVGLMAFNPKDIPVRGSVDPRAIVRLEGLREFKNAINSRGIEPAAFRLVAEYAKAQQRVFTYTQLR